MWQALLIPVLLFVLYHARLSNRRLEEKTKADWVPPVIQPVEASFDWKKAQPLPIRPFVGKKNFKPSMSVHNSSSKRESFLLIENTYLDNTNLRREVAKKYADKIMYCNQSPRLVAALKEFYELVVKFLCDRYPHYFIENEKGNIKNLINNDEFPLSAENADTKDLLRILAGNLEEDFLILLKDNPTDHDEEYILRSSLTGSPAGFDPSHNFDKPVSFIHVPVPQYKERLKSPMNRFFNRLEPKDMWERANWSVQTNTVTFKLDSHHAREGEIVKEMTMNDIDFENACFLRCERQVFTRLPKSRGIIMLVRTYMTPIKQIRDEGLGPTMAHAIDSLPDDLGFYKRRQEWGSAVKQFLREPIGSELENDQIEPI